MNIILATHGHLASGMKSAVEMILGKADYISCYDLAIYKTPYSILDEIKESENTIIITDMLGGSINNTLLKLMSKNILVAGMNLGLVLEICMHRNDKDLEENIQNIISETSESICFVNKKKNEYIEMEGTDLW